MSIDVELVVSLRWSAFEWTSAGGTRETTGDGEDITLGKSFYGVSIMPSIHREDAVVRILDKRWMTVAYGSLTLEALRFDAASLVTLRALTQDAGQNHYPVRGAHGNP